MEQDKICDNNQSVFSRDVYANKDFWNERFKNEKHMFDWYVNWRQLKKYFLWLILPKKARILIVGCGNSKLTQEMYRDGWKDIVNIDISDEVVKKMKEHHEKLDIHCEWIEMDATKMSFPDDSFDVVIDKGTLDAVLCGKDYYIPNKMLREMYRVVRPDCSVMLISHGSIPNRKFLFESNFYPEEVSVLCHKQDLSPEVNLINAMRSIGKDKSLLEIMKNEAMIKECAKIMKETSQDVDSDQIDNGEHKTETKKNKSGWIKIDFEHMNIIQSSSGQIESNGNSTKLDENSPESEQTFEEKNQLRSKIVKKVQDSGYNPPRQNHCFIYFVKKTAAKESTLQK